MADQIFTVTWECISCFQEHSFRYILPAHGEWPNKFEDLTCENSDCGQTQDVPFRKCSVEPYSLSSSAS